MPGTLTPNEVSAHGVICKAMVGESPQTVRFTYQSERGEQSRREVEPYPLDSDNLAGAFKAVRDAVAKELGLDDGDARIEWRYEQIDGRGEHGIEIQIAPGSGAV